MDKTYISIREASKITGLCQQTLRTMCDKNKIKYYKTSSGQRKFEKENLEELCNSKIKKNVKDKENFVYVRVYSDKDIETLSQQVEFIKNINKDYSSYTFITDYSSGINLKRKGLSMIIDACVKQTIGEIVIAHNDIISKYNYDIINMFVEKCGGSIISLSNDKYKCTDKELLDDILCQLKNK